MDVTVTMTATQYAALLKLIPTAIQMAKDAESHRSWPRGLKTDAYNLGKLAGQLSEYGG